jgi:hypothetical protein
MEHNGGCGEPMTPEVRAGTTDVCDLDLRVVHVEPVREFAPTADLKVPEELLDQLVNGPICQDELERCSAR